MGEVEVPRDALWRAQTQRAVENFPISGTHPRGRARPGARPGQGRRRAGQRRARRDHRRAGRRDPRRRRRRSSTAGTTTHFPIDVFQTGSGTSSNMNMNEVLASLAARAGVDVPPQRPRQRQPVQQRHLPDLDPRRGRPRRPRSDLVPALRPPRDRARGARPRSSPTSVKSGRTHLMDATPVMLGQELGGYAAAMRLRHRAARARRCPGCAELPLGGTAVGTGINTPAGLRRRG